MKKRVSPKLKINKDLLRIYKIFFGRISFVIIHGIWRQGKTDTALKIAEDCLKLKIISKIGSNIETPDERVQSITSVQEAKYWLHRDRYRKMLIIDEANIHFPRRQAMTRKSVEYIKIFGEVSKAHGRMIVVGQDIVGLEKEFKNPVWLRGTIFKPKRHVTVFRSRYLRGEKQIINWPKTTIKFDPDKIAPFTLEAQESIRKFFKDEDTEKLWLWCNGASSRELGLHPMQLNRLTRKFIKLKLAPIVEAKLKA